ncbi:MAG: SNF2-related protein [Chloroflexota bacterium]|nr:SNF2-related protein [Chloroflexota bacterium]MDE2946822.1 SNF2-related protein [Chloroflexota bacterium]
MTFEPGQIVKLRVDPSRQGPITRVLPSVGGSNRYLVFHADGNMPIYTEEQLVLAESHQTSAALEDALRSGNFIALEDFRARVTAARLSTPLTDSLYSLHAARIQYIPFQFKPLLRFLRAETPRLLIADEVGVGKTIEAGLILREMQSRQDVGNVLIVCPKALVTKWRKEMLRFDEDFRSLDGNTLRYCIRETALDGDWPLNYSRAIVPLELLRREEFLDAPRRNKDSFRTLDPGPRFSLVIFDEAHHLRTRSTSSWKIARYLCDYDNSEAVVFLSATPVHLHSRNLYNLLNLLRPELFSEESIYQQMMEPNAHLLRAMRHIRQRQPSGKWQWNSLGEIQHATDTTWGRATLQRDPRLKPWMARLSSTKELDEQERIRLLRELEELHTLAHVMNRTRRRDIGRFTTREPVAIETHFTPEQKNFYQALIVFRQGLLLREHSPGVVRLVSHTLERQATSCLPAMLPLIDGFLHTGRFSTIDYTDDLDQEEDDQLPEEIVEQAGKLRHMASQLPNEDPKFTRFKQILDKTILKSATRKVLVFSYFLHTLDYLEGKLRADGYRVLKINGKTRDEARDDMRKRFRLPHTNPDSVDVLLSSEVGCEGLDYEFCDCLVNYDIPWNPMRIEQRIGRIDRFGQKSDKVHIYNFITPDTVEERIFYRCFERLGVFRDTVGDLEEVLGDLTDELQRLAFDPSLSVGQAQERALQEADNKIRYAEEHRIIGEDSDALLGFEQSFTEEVEALERAGRFVSPADLAQMIQRFVERPELGGALTAGRRDRTHRLRLNSEAREKVSSSLSSKRLVSRMYKNFRIWLRQGNPALNVTFDRETALNRRDLPFITPVHPLAKVAIDHWQQAVKPLVARLVLQCNSINPGFYLIALELWETIAARREYHVKAFAWDMERTCVSSALDGVTARLAETSELQNSAVLADLDLDTALGAIDEHSYEVKLRNLLELKRNNDELLDLRRNSQEAHFENRLARVRQDLRQATEPRIRIMRKAEANRIEIEKKNKLAEIENRRECEIVTERIALALLRVEEE